MTGGIIGPIATFGYPIRPINTLGGDEPSNRRLSMSGFTFTLEWYRTITGQRAFPHKYFVPRHNAHTLVDCFFSAETSFF
jgi:hypothetical protein